MGKIHRQYRFKFYLNMNHFIIIDNMPGEVHPHTWEIVVSVVSDQEQMTPFINIERKIDGLMEQYQDRLLNECEPFDTIVPTVENAARYFFRRIQDGIIDEGWILLMLEVSETPTRSYVINALMNEDSIWEDEETPAEKTPEEKGSEEEEPVRAEVFFAEEKTEMETENSTDEKEKIIEENSPEEEDGSKEDKKKEKHKKEKKEKKEKKIRKEIKEKHGKKEGKKKDKKEKGKKEKDKKKKQKKKKN